MTSFILAFGSYLGIIILKYILVGQLTLFCAILRVFWGLHINSHNEDCYIISLWISFSNIFCHFELQILSFLSDIPTVHLIVVCYYFSYSILSTIWISTSIILWNEIYDTEIWKWCWLCSFLYSSSDVFSFSHYYVGCWRDRWTNTFPSIFNWSEGCNIFNIAQSGNSYPPYESSKFCRSLGRSFKGYSLRNS